MSLVSRFKKSGRNFPSAQDRAAARVAGASRARQQMVAARRAGPAPDLTYGDMILAERQSIAMRQSGRYQAVSSKEVKCFDCAVTDAAAGITWALSAAGFAEPGVAFTGITELNDIQQGATVYQRIGVKVLMRSIRLRGTLQASAITALCHVRLAVIYDRQPNGAAPAIGDIYVDCNGAGGTSLSSSINITNKNRFTVLRDQLIPMDPAQELTKEVDWFIPCRLQSEYKASGATIGDISTGSLILVAGAINAAGFTNFSNFRCRIRYED